MTVKEATKADEDEDLAIEIHTIKGLADTIGAENLFKQAKSFEANLRKGNFNVENYHQFLASFQDIITSLDTYFEANPFHN